NVILLMPAMTMMLIKVAGKFICLAE
ncbi:MAG: hypothetical protein ACI8P3_004202, partial [Saprospiraceae bacterium]